LIGALLLGYDYPAMSSELLYFVHLTDTHFGSEKSYLLNGVNTYDWASKAIDAINSLPHPVDFIMHTGDIVDMPETAAYQLAAKVLGQIKHPNFYFVSGNHDRTTDILKHFKLPAGVSRASKDNLSYSFSVKDTKFLVLDARGPDSIDPRGLLSDETLGFCETELSKPWKHLIAFLHFAPHPLMSKWMDGHMLVENGDKLHKLLVSAKAVTKTVLYGHIHQSMQILKDGVAYITAPATCYALHAFPGDTFPNKDPNYLGGFNLVTVTPEQVIVRQHYVR